MAIILLQILLLVSLSKTALSAEDVYNNISLPGCPNNCGGISIPYPFGIGTNCSLSTDFNVTCAITDNGDDPFLDKARNGKPTPYLGSIEILNISIPLGQARFNNPITSQCYNTTTNHYVSWFNHYVSRFSSYESTPFWLNKEKNKFIVLGCNTLAYFLLDTMNQKNYSVGCLSTCDDLESLNKYGSACSGIGCCQTSIPEVTSTFFVDFDDRFNESIVHNFAPCSHAMVMENTDFKFNASLITTDGLLDEMMLPAVFDWAIGHTTCNIAETNKSSYACKSSYSACLNSSTGQGYICNCSDGYQGNPYLPGGCQDIDECVTYKPCPTQAKCHNLQGTYECKCHFGWRSNNNNICELNLTLVIGITIMLGFMTSVIAILLYMSISKHIKLFENRKLEKLKHKFFIQNRGLLLQQLIYSHEDTEQKMRIFRLIELEKATNKFDKALILGRGGHGEVYKGILSDQRVVAIKISKFVDQGEIDQFINELVILSQINHRNVVKLFGCCLETEVPILIYEFISNGTLYNHLHGGEHCSLTWKQRLRISVEVARAISYLHSSASISIFHRDIKSVNILLDDYFTAKVSDFGASRSVQIGQTGVTTAIQGTYGYLDPEYYYNGRLTQKSDVYSFGVILAELLTREKPVFCTSTFEGCSLVAYFRSAMSENRLFEILDPLIVDEGNKEGLDAVARLAEMCLKMKGEERPTMKEVEVQLEILWQSNKQQKQSCTTSQILEERELLLLEDYTKHTDTTRQYSFEKELQSSAKFPR